MSRLPLGNSDFRSLRMEGSLYVDKTATILRLLNSNAKVTLFCRPRRFGKTLFLSTMRYFFEQHTEDRKALFEGLAIWNDATSRQHFQSYPVIWLSLKDVKAAHWKDAWDLLQSALMDACRPFEGLEEDARLSVRDRAMLKRWLDGEASTVQWKNFLRDLSVLLRKIYGRPVVILIDEYDTPIHSAWIGGYYEKMAEFFRSFFGAGLKDNPSLNKAVLTGILQVAKEGMFSSLNNLDVFSVLDQVHAEAFGFTESEVAWLQAACQSPHSMELLRAWYNGYHIGPGTVYNPWSIIACLSRPEEPPAPYWVNTGSTDSLGDMIWNGDQKFLLDLQTMLQGDTVQRFIPESTPLPGMGLPELRALLLHAGYYTTRSVQRVKNGWTATLVIPNQDVEGALTAIVRRWLDRAQPSENSVRILLNAMLAGQVEIFEQRLNDLLVRAMSFHDLVNPDPERVYHAFILGLLVLLDTSHRVWSNPESGDGRADALVIPRQAGGTGVVLEFKKVEKVREMAAGLEDALQQVEENRYRTRLVEAQAGKIYVYGLVFCGKKVRVGAGH